MPRIPPGHERQIHERARRMWRDDGRPRGRLPEYVARAREIQALEDHPQSGMLPNPMARHHGEIVPPEPVEKAEILEILGEFPGLLTDPGDRLPAPMTKKARRELKRP